MSKEIKSVSVVAKIASDKVWCEVLRCWQNRATQKSYAVIRAPLFIEDNPDIIIPFVFEPDKNVQDAIVVTEAQDRSAIEEVIDKNSCVIQYELPDGITFQIHIEHWTDAEQAERANNAQREAELRRGLGGLSLPERIDDVIRNIDTRIIILAVEEYLSNLTHDDSVPTKVITGLILHLLEQKTLLTNFPFNEIEQILSSKKVDVSQEEAPLLRAFSNLIMVFSRTEIIRQDVENTMVTLVECELCTKEMYDAIIGHETFSKVFSGDDLQRIRNNVILRVSRPFSANEIKSAANYFYARKKYRDAVLLFELQLNILENGTSDSKEKDMADALNSIGCCYVSLMCFNEAYTAFKRATEIDHDFAVAYNNWAYTIAVECDTLPKNEARKTKLYDAITYVSDAIQLSGKDVSFVSNKAFIEYELGQYEQVLRENTRAQTISSKYSDISTVLKLSIDAKIKLYINSPSSNPLSFSKLYEDLNTIFINETGGNKYYFEALDVYNKIGEHEDENDVEKVTFELILIEFYIKELMSEIAIRNPNQEVYYYTSMASLTKLLCDDAGSIRYRLPVFNASHMNDPSEGQELFKAFSQYVITGNLMEDLFRQPIHSTSIKRRQLDAEFTFLKAFTMNDDSLPMWVHYADTGKGCCVKVNARFFTNFDNDSSDNEKKLESNPFDNAYRLYEVLYLKDGKITNHVSTKVNTIFDNIFIRASGISSLYDKLSENSKRAVVSAVSKMVEKLKYLFKSSDYFYEQEMRIVLRRSLQDFQRDDIDVQMTTATTDLPIPKLFIYTDKSVAIDEVIIGPKVNETDNIIPFLAMKLLRLNDHNADKVCITKSAIEYR